MGHLIHGPFLVARFFLGLGVDDVEEVHVELAVAAEDVQLFHQNHVQLRVGLLGADGRRQARRAAAHDDDVALLRFPLGGGVLPAGGGHGDLHRLQARLLHGVGHGALHRIRGEGSRAYAVHYRGVGLQDALADYREGPVDDHVGLVVIAEDDIGNRALVDCHLDLELAAVAVAAGGIHLRFGGCGGTQQQRQAEQQAELSEYGFHHDLLLNELTAHLGPAVDGGWPDIGTGICHAQKEWTNARNIIYKCLKNVNLNNAYI